MSKSHFANFCLEYLRRNIIEDEVGFVTYSITNDSIHIEDIFVDEKFREKGHASRLANLVADFGKENGCKTMTAQVALDQDPDTISRNMEVQLSYGFKIYGADKIRILTFKELK